MACGRIDTLATKLNAVRITSGHQARLAARRARSEIAFRFQCDIVGAMDRERRDSEESNHNGVPVENAGMRADLEICPKRFKKIPVGTEWHAANDIADRCPEKNCEQHAGKGKYKIEERPPERIINVGAELDADTAQHQEPENDHQRQIEAAEARCVKRRKSEKQRACRGHKPNLVAIPYQPDGAQDQMALVMGSRDKQADDAGTEIEAVEHHVSDDHQRDENEPKCFRITLLRLG